MALQNELSFLLTHWGGAIKDLQKLFMIICFEGLKKIKEYFLQSINIK